MSKVKWLFAVCLMAVFVCLGALDVRAEETEIDTSVFRYEENDDGTITVSRYCGTDETVIVPSEIDGKPVKSIGWGAFMKCNTIKHLMIQEGITDIEACGYDGAFEQCENLETVSLPATLKTIGDYAFDKCYKLREINLPNGLISIGKYAFYRCGLNHVDLPNGLSRIEDGAFGYCSITKIVIPDSVYYIGDHTTFFIGHSNVFTICANPDSYAREYADEMRGHSIRFSCINHSNVVTDNEIPATCTKNGQTAGSHCAECGTFIIEPQIISPKGHKIITVDKKPTCTESGEYYTYCEVCGEKNIDEKGDHIQIPGREVAFGHKYDNGVIQSGVKIYTCTVCGKTKTGKITAPKKGKIISSDSKDSYRVTKSGTKNGTVEYTGTKSSKTNITIPKTVTIDGITYKVTSIAKNAFKNNKMLKNVTMGSNITSINASAFSGCKNLKTITIQSKNIKSVGKNAFKGINAKAKIKVPSSKLTKYKKLFAGKGQKSTVKITK